MIKDKLAEAVKTGLNNIKKGDDHVPLQMRGELEVIVKDRDGNILSYERDHNQVTKLAKMAIIHLLAGEIGTIDQPLDLVENERTAGMRALYLEGSSPDPQFPRVQIPSKFDPGTEQNPKHSMSLNKDGQLVSGMQFFYDGFQVINTNKISILSQVMPYEGNDLYAFNYPTKMLFGTGLEAYDGESFDAAYADALIDRSVKVSFSTAARINGYSSREASQMTIERFFMNLDATGGLSTNDFLSNWYSSGPYRCRTLQPATTEPLSATPDSGDTAIKGAIKNCYITSTSEDDKNKYNPSTKMAFPDYRGYGYPAFIYATRSTDTFYKSSKDNTNVFYQKNDIFDVEPYETELTYTVVMPAQPVNSNRIEDSYYPYNGWILKQAGLFCDSRYMLRSRNNDPDLGEAKFIELVNSGNKDDSNSAHIYRDSVGGQMLFTRNLSSPIMKTADTEIAFVWHIFITV